METKNDNQLRRYMREFLEYNEVEKQHSQLTIRNYAHYLNRFADWAAGEGITTPSAITLEVTRRYRLWLNRLEHRGAPLHRKTQNYHVIALRAFLKYLAKRDIGSLDAAKIELGKTEQRTIEFLTAEECAQLLEATGSKRSFSSYRDRAILELLFSTGLRVSELTALNTNQVNLDRGEFMVRGKGDKPRLVFVSKRAIDWVERYLQTRTVAMQPLFTRFAKLRDEPDGADLRLTPRSIQRMIKKHTATAGIVKDVTPHTLRHSFATDLLQNGADIRSVQQLLGHSSITTTQVYTHATNRHLREVHQRFHGKS